jgi:type II restriction enzyme
MSINADKPHRWKADIAASVDLFNQWFLAFRRASWHSSDSPHDDVSAVGS